MPSAGHTDRGESSAGAWRDRLAAGLMTLAAVGALVAALGSIGSVRDADAATRIVEAWRGYGFLLFAGMFALLAWRPRQAPGLWELAIFHKVALTLTGLAWLSGDVTGASTVAVSDGILTLLLTASYVLTRGWTAWRR